ncbi:calcium-binding protein [Novosphingobium sp.]|uniref:calcium-binding protein n=1 Tax=Novosphingobium sp. TaxID=1874826 RepID=UPI003016DE52
MFAEALKGADVIVLSNEDDVMNGFVGNDVITGNAGNDTLAGDDGNDRILGGAGNDIISGDTGNEMISGGAGTDIATYGSAGKGVTVDLGLTAAQDTGGAGIDRLSGIEGLIGSDFADVLTGNKVANEISGGGGDDTLLGLGGNDLLRGGRGNDRIDGGAGIDTASYEDSDARVVVTLGLAGPQDTRGGGKDTLVGIENVLGSIYDDKIVGDAGANVILGGSGADSIVGGDGNDTLYGSYGPGIYGDYGNRLNGGGGNDVLVGAYGQDTLVGGTGNDTLAGQEEPDVLTGGTGADRFVLASDNAFYGVDLITDFSAAQNDKIGLSLTQDAFEIGFTFLAGPGGSLAASEFYSASGANTAHDDSDRIIYDSSSGALYYDADGTGADSPCRQIAQLGSGSTHPALTLIDFVILA